VKLKVIPVFINLSNQNTFLLVGSPQNFFGKLNYFNYFLTYPNNIKMQQVEASTFKKFRNEALSKIFSRKKSPEAEYFQNFEFKSETFELKAKHKQLEHTSQG
jgi:hypothetical protein